MAGKDQECASASTCGRSSCEGCPSKSAGPQSFRAEQNAYSDIKHVIGVVSGKGGVGKSLVTASLANALAKTGARVGILDADITGPSIPKMYGLEKPAEALAEDQILPEVTDNGIKVMSLNLIMPDPEQAVIWRGPILAGVVKQFWTDVVWGELDYLLVDMPPGTGDVPLTVYQSLPLDGVFIAIGTAGSVVLAKKMGIQLEGRSVKVDENMATNVPGVFAAGDCIGGMLQVASAVYEGAQAGTSAVKFLRGK